MFKKNYNDCNKRRKGYMTQKEAIRLLDIVTDVNGQYTKQERIRAAMRLEELLRLLLPE